MAGVNVKGDIAVDRDTSIGRDAAITTDLTVGQDATVTRDVSAGQDISAGRDASVATDLTVGQDADVTRNLKSLRSTQGSVRTSTIQTILTETSPYETILTGTSQKFVRLPAPSTTAGAAVGLGAEFRVTNDLDTDTASDTVAVLSGSVPVGINLLQGQTAIFVCVNAAAVLPVLPWKQIILDPDTSGRIDPVSVPIINAGNPSTDSWIPSLDGEDYTASFIVPSTHSPFPVISIKDNNSHVILVDYFQLGSVLRINVTANPDARFSGSVEFS